IELEQKVARRQRHLRELADIPSADDQPPRIGIRFDLLENLSHLVDLSAVGSGPRAPLLAVDRPQLAVFISPLVPDRNAAFLEVADVRLAAQEPEQLVNDRPRVQLLRSYERKTLPQVESHLIAKDAQRAGA